jgi:hypothetical protein
VPASTAAADDGHGGAVPEAAAIAGGAGTSDLPVLTAWNDHRPAEPGLDHGHHVHPAAAGVRVPGGRAGLVLTVPPGVVGLQHAELPVLRRDAAAGAGPVRPAADLQQRPGRAVYKRGVHKDPGVGGRRHQHGRPRPGAGQRVRGTAVADGEVQGGVPEGLRGRAGVGRGSRGVLRLLQRRASAPGRRRRRCTSVWPRRSGPFYACRTDRKEEDKGTLQGGRREWASRRGSRSLLSHRGQADDTEKANLIRPQICPAHGEHLTQPIR